jgi:hypothetical protein
MTHEAEFNQYWISALFVSVLANCVNITDDEKKEWRNVLAQYNVYYAPFATIPVTGEQTAVQPLLDKFGILVGDFATLYARQLHVVNQYLQYFRQRAQSTWAFSQDEINMLATIADFTRFHPFGNEMKEFWELIDQRRYLINHPAIIMIMTLRSRQDSTRFYDVFDLVHEIPYHLIKVTPKHAQLVKMYPLILVK